MITNLVTEKSSTESPKVVEPDKVAIDILVTDEETTYSLAINEPEIFTLLPSNFNGSRLPVPSYTKLPSGECISCW